MVGNAKILCLWGFQCYSFLINFLCSWEIANISISSSFTEEKIRNSLIIRITMMSLPFIDNLLSVVPCLISMNYLSHWSFAADPHRGALARPSLTCSCSLVSIAFQVHFSACYKWELKCWVCLLHLLGTNLQRSTFELCLEVSGSNHTNRTSSHFRKNKLALVVFKSLVWIFERQGNYPKWYDRGGFAGKDCLQNIWFPPHTVI